MRCVFTRARLAVILFIAVACRTVPVAVGPIEPPPPAPMPGELLDPESFSGIEDPIARSRALFTEAGKVLTHPRCTNCHPADDSPRQGAGKLHEPPVQRGAGGHGVFINACHSCHQDHNGVDAPVPGAPLWHLAPKTMAWHGASLATLCAQLKDPALNGGRNLDQIVAHSLKDPLVAWGWAPGAGRAPVPGTQQRFGALMAAWAATGAACPD